jgi:hypothetical protein
VGGVAPIWVIGVGGYQSSIHQSSIHHPSIINTSIVHHHLSFVIYQLYIMSLSEFFKQESVFLAVNLIIGVVLVVVVWLICRKPAVQNAPPKFQPQPEPLPPSPMPDGLGNGNPAAILGLVLDGLETYRNQQTHIDTQLGIFYNQLKDKQLAAAAQTRSELYQFIQNTYLPSLAPYEHTAANFYQEGADFGKKALSALNLERVLGLLNTPILG